MAIHKRVFEEIIASLKEKHVQLIAVSKTKPVEDIQQLYELGQRDFGENYVQELLEKQPRLPKDIRWHFIGHLQSNKVKFIVPFVHLIHGIDSVKLLREINKQANKQNLVVDCLLQVHIAEEETKYGFDEKELDKLFSYQAEEITELANVRIRGLMGMASFSEDDLKVRGEYKKLKSLFDKFSQFQSKNVRFEILSMGMSGDYTIAIEEGSTMVRIGSLIFGERNYHR